MTKEKENSTTSPHVFYKNMADDSVAAQILNIIEHNEDISQLKIIKSTGLGAGLVHSYMNKVIRKGWVKAKQVSARRWLYYLTPEGFVEKSRLTIKYMSITLNNFRDMNNMVHENLNAYLNKGWKDLVVAGDSDLAEISALNIKAFDGLNLAGIVADNAGRKFMAGVGIKPYNSIDEIEYDRILVCDTSFLDWFQDKGNNDKASLLIHP